MLFVQLDANWPDNPKVIRAGWEAAGVHAAIMCVAKRLETDGWVDLLLLRRMEVPDEALDRLTELRLIERDGERVRVNDWHDRNPSQAAISASRASKVRAGKQGNHVRYEHVGELDDCRICYPDEQAKPQRARTCDSQTLAEHSHTASLIVRDTGAIAASDHPPPEVYRLSEEAHTGFMAGVELVRQQTGYQRKASA